MSPEGVEILKHLAAVAVERARRESDSPLAERVRQVKHFQHARFASTYADLLLTARFGPAARFFLDDLYGPADFTQRDDQFARIVPALVRLFPLEIVRTVRDLAHLHSLSERLDTEMGAEIQGEGILDADEYGRAWRRIGKAAARDEQVTLMLAVGHALERLTRNPILRHSLKLMRGPAQAAGLGALQLFLERGFDTFRQMRGAEEFLATIASRERALSEALHRGP